MDLFPKGFCTTNVGIMSESSHSMDLSFPIFLNESCQPSCWPLFHFYTGVDLSRGALQSHQKEAVLSGKKADGPSQS